VLLEHMPLVALPLARFVQLGGIPIRGPLLALLAKLDRIHPTAKAARFARQVKVKSNTDYRQVLYMYSN
jgi:hypothetical protein